MSGWIQAAMQQNTIVTLRDWYVEQKTERSNLTVSLLNTYSLDNHSSGSYLDLYSSFA